MQPFYHLSSRSGPEFVASRWHDASVAPPKRSNTKPTANASSDLECDRDSRRDEGDRRLASGDEAGTAPEDRRFRPDVEGLRAVAVLIVVLFHVFVTAKSRAFSGGYVGVNVFFVISGFVITGLLLRECNATGRIGLVAFYARRARRIIPAMALVIIVSLVVERILIGASATSLVASDAKWSSVFLANIHFTKVYPTFLVHRPDTPLQNYWSLAVEEQFYLVYPAIILMVAVGIRRGPLRLKMGIVLCAIIVVSFAWFIASTSFAALAYSPLALAWELGLGALVAVCTVQLKKLSPTVAAVMTWVGLGGILVAALVFTLTSPYPWLVAGLPVLSTVLVIAGGTAAPRRGAESLLRLAPFKWLGRWSYSYYLWHWPILIFAVQHWGHPSVIRNLALACFALGISAISYFYVENPIRHSKLFSQSSKASILAGAILITVCFGLASAITL